MPFQSEKQRRFLWSQHPDIAKRWADEYPNQKNLPTYAHKDKKTKAEKRANALVGLVNLMTKCALIDVKPVLDSLYVEYHKKADSELTKVQIPHSDKPTYAGEEHIQAGENQDQKSAPGAYNQSTQELAGFAEDGDVNPLLKKLSVVLSQAVQQAVMDEQAQAQGQQQAAQAPANAGLKTYPAAAAAPANPLPIGAQQQPAPAAQAQQAMQPQQPVQAQQPQQPKTAAAAGMLPLGTIAPRDPKARHKKKKPAVKGGIKPIQPFGGGGGSNPMFNPINAFGGISVDGNINGNAAFGAKNSPDSSKSAAMAFGASVGAASA